MFYKQPYLNRNKRKFSRATGLPADYPKPEPSENLLFYIQRNHNLNTIIYKININNQGIINESDPVLIQWIRFNESGQIKELTYLQNKLAYGCEFFKINQDSYEFKFVSYPKLTFFIGKNSNGSYAAFYRGRNGLIQLSNIYVHADEFGLFPDVKFIEFYGHDVDTNKKVLQKLKL